jgi:hypothetical protein
LKDRNGQAFWILLNPHFLRETSERKMPALDRRTLIKNMLPGAVMTVAGTTAWSYLLKPTVAEALSIPQKKIDAEPDVDFVQKTQVVVTRRVGPRRRRVCWWHRGRRICRWRTW